jgi:ribonuclease HI
MNLTIHLRTGTKGQSAAPVAVGVIVESEDPKEIRYAAGHFFESSRPVAEAAGLLEAVRVAKASQAEEVTILADSVNLVKRVTGELFDEDERIVDMIQLVQAALLSLDVWTIKHSPKDDIGKAERLVRTALDAGKTVVVVDEANPGNAAGFESLTPDYEVLKKAADVAGKKRVKLEEVEEEDVKPAGGRRHEIGGKKGHAHEDESVAPKPARGAANSGGVNNSKFLVVVDEGAACPNGSTDGAAYQFGPCTAPGLCVYAAAAAFSVDPLHWRSVNHKRIITSCAVCRAGVSVEKA